MFPRRSCLAAALLVVVSSPFALAAPPPPRVPVFPPPFNPQITDPPGQNAILDVTLSPPAPPLPEVRLDPPIVIEVGPVSPSRE